MAAPGKTDIRRLRKLILLYTTVGVVVVTVISAALGIWPIFRILQTTQQQHLEQVVQTRTRSIEQFVSGAQSVTRQITSRTRARNLLEAYNLGRLPLGDYVQQSTVILNDALRLSEEVIGIIRLDGDGVPRVRVGRSFPPSTWPEPAATRNDVPVAGPLLDNGELIITLRAPIVNVSGSHVGTDVVCFRFDELAAILGDRSGLGESGAIYLGLETGDRTFTVRAGEETPATLRQVLDPQASFIRAALQPGRDRGQHPSTREGRTLFFAQPVGQANWAVVVTMDRRELYGPVYRQIIGELLVIALLSVLGALGMLLILRPLTGGILMHDDALRQRIGEATHKLQEQNRLLRNANRELATYNTRYHEELELAQNVQMGFLPTTFPHHDRITFDKYYMSCDILGGDLFDVFEVGPHRVAMYVADVAGHGVSAALISGLLKMAISSIRQSGGVGVHDYNPDLLHPGRILELLNDQLHGEMPEDEFITMLFGILDVRTMELTLANAGHPDPVCYRVNTRDLETLSVRAGAALGLLRNTTYPEDHYALEPGDQVVFYTDGVTEAMDQHNEEFGQERLFSTLLEAYRREPGHVTMAIRQAVDDHCQGRAVADDFTILACEIR